MHRSSYPLLLPETNTHSAFHGFIKVGDQEYRIRIKTSVKPAPTLGKRKRPAPGDNRYPMDFSSPTVFSNSSVASRSSTSTSSTSTPSSSTSSTSTTSSSTSSSSSSEFLWVEPALAQLLSGYVAILKQRQTQCTDLSDLLVETQLIAARANVNAPVKPRKLPSPEFYSALLHDIRQVGWDRLLALDSSLSTLSFALSESGSSSSFTTSSSSASSSPRMHTLELKLPFDYPSHAPVHIAQCPEQIEIGDVKSVTGIVRKYEDELPRFEAFWQVMEDWDQHCWVLEPAHPTRACSYRRVVLGNNLSLHVEVDPAKPFEICECSFFGADTAVTPLRARWFAGMSTWNLEETPRLNLQRILQVQFPPNTAKNREAFNLECGICYAYTPPEGEGIPDQMCENSRCGRGFHHACLRDWLRAVPVSRQSFQTLFGECPYCSEPISISISGKADD